MEKVLLDMKMKKIYYKNYLENIHQYAVHQALDTNNSENHD